MEVKILVYLITGLAALGLLAYMSGKYKLSRYQLMIFFLLTLFWSANVIIRAYRKSYALNPPEAGGLGLDFAQAAVIASGYGFISIFARAIVLFLSDRWQSRKKVILLGLISVALTGLWVLLSPDFSSLLASSLALGLGASMLSLFNLFFAESFAEKEALLSVSILSVAPLLAEFIMSSFQYAFTLEGEENYPALWFLSILFSLVAMVFLFFVKEKKSERLSAAGKGNMNREAFLSVIRDKRSWLYAFLGVIISLIRFSTSGSNMITYFQSDLVQMNALMVAYSDFVYAIAQLLAGVLIGTVLSRRLGLKKSLLLGIFCGSFFNLLLLLSRDPALLFYTSMLQGFSYGITYNALIGLTMLSVELHLRDMSMAFFQTFFALGIFYGDMIYKTVADLLAGNSVEATYHNVFLFIFILSLLLLALVAVAVKDTVAIKDTGAERKSEEPAGSGAHGAIDQ